MPSTSRAQASGSERGSHSASSHSNIVPTMSNGYHHQVTSTLTERSQHQGDTLIERGLPQQRMPEPDSTAYNAGGPGAQDLIGLALLIEYRPDYPQQVDDDLSTTDGPAVPAAGQAANTLQDIEQQHPRGKPCGTQFDAGQP